MHGIALLFSRGCAGKWLLAGERGVVVVGRIWVVKNSLGGEKNNLGGEKNVWVVKK